MYDKIRASQICGADYSDFKWLVTQLSENAHPKYIVKVSTFKKLSFKIYKDLDAVDASDRNLRKGHSYILLTMEYSLKSKVLTLAIDNSWRKWYHGANSLADLSYRDYVHCQELLAAKLNLSIDFLRDFKIFDLEIGATCLFDKRFKLFTLCIIDHKYLKGFMRTNKQSVTVIGDNYSLKCYDKEDEIKKIKYRNLPDHSVDDCYIRSEIKITKPSGVAIANENFRTLKQLDVNFEKAFTFLYNQLQYLKFTDCISPQIVENLYVARDKNANNKNKNKEFHDLIKFQGVDALGMDTIRELANEFTDKPSSAINKYGEIETKFRELQNPSYRRLFFNKLKEKKLELIM